MFIEVQSEAEETQTLVYTGRQQHQELLDDALKEGGKSRRRREKRKTAFKDLPNANDRQLLPEVAQAGTW